MTLVLDAGAFVAIEKGDRSMWRRLKSAQIAGSPPTTHGGVVAQVWRGGGGRQAQLARFLRAIEIVPLDDQMARRAGVLLARTRRTDAIDAAVVALAMNEDQIATGDQDDIAELIEASGLRIDLIPV